VEKSSTVIDMKRPIVKRFYRERYSERFNEFYVKYKHTDMWIGVGKSCEFSVRMVDFAYEKVKITYDTLDEYIKENPEFGKSLVPLMLNNLEVPEFIKNMVDASQLAEVGPMACVAGMFAQIVGEELMRNYNCNGVIVENGGDIYVNTDEEIKIGIFANFDSEFNKLSLVLEPGEYGVCTSSGKIGHSLNFGNADAVIVISKDSAISDAFATKYSNMVRTSEDVEKVLAKAKEEIGKSIEGIIVIYRDIIGALGKVKFSY